MKTRLMLVPALAAALLAGCGGDEGIDTSNPRALADEVVANLERQENLQIRAEAESASQGQPDALEFQVTPAGTSGSISGEGVTLDIVTTGETSFIRAPEEYWQQQGVPPQAVSSLTDQWIELNAAQSQQLSGQFEQFSVDGIVSQYREELPENLVAEKTTYEGGDAVRLTDEGEKGDGILAAGDPLLPVEIFSADDESGLNRLRLAYEDTEPVRAPSDSITLEEVAALGGGAGGDGG